MRHQRGSALVEFAMVLPLFVILLFAVIETARLMYLANTLAEASRRAVRAAAVANFADPLALAQIKRRAMFNTPSGRLPYGEPYSADNIQIAYLGADGSTPVSPMPACPEENQATCLANPNGAACIRYVRVRMCQPGEITSCSEVRYQPLVDVGGFFPSLPLPTFTVVAPVESLGLAPGAQSTCP